jgi:formate-dependent nitrite reductase membrane component NrfD
MGDYTWFHDVSWHATYAIYFFVIGICAGLAFLSYGSWTNPALRSLREKAAWGSFALLVIGGLLLIADLSQPMRFLNILNPAYLNFTSPLAWGALNIVAFGIASVLYLLVLRKAPADAAAAAGADAGGRGKLLATLVALLALGLPIYTGYDLTVHQSRPVWNTPIMPVLFVALAIASGSAVGALLAGSDQASQKVLRQYMLWSTGAVGVILISILGTTHYGGSASELTFVILTTGTMGLVFVGLGLVAGTAAPVALLYGALGNRKEVLLLAALLILLGSAALRYALLMGPQHLQTLY